MKLAEEATKTFYILFEVEINNRAPTFSRAGELFNIVNEKFTLISCQTLLQADEHIMKLEKWLLHHG